MSYWVSFLGPSISLLRSAIMECLVTPLQERMEEWKKITTQLDKEHAKGNSSLTMRTNGGYSYYMLVLVKYILSHMHSLEKRIL